jgi:hypothetical protein
VCARIGRKASVRDATSAIQAIEFSSFYQNCGLARNLNAAVQPAAGDAVLAPSKMDFRSNEADRTVLKEISRFPSGQNPLPR